jgi:hypothetical protein
MNGIPTDYVIGSKRFPFAFQATRPKQAEFTANLWPISVVEFNQ